MRKIIITAVALATLSSGVQASKSRILALGDNVEDNYFVEDARNIFTNAAQVNNYKNIVTMEWGGNPTGFDSTANPLGQGGFLMDCGSMVCGAFLGNESTISASLRTIATDIGKTGTAGMKTPDNQLDLFIGGESSVKWGAGLVYSDFEKKDAAGKKITATSSAIRLGLLAKTWETYANISIGGKSEAVTGTDLGAGAATVTEDQKFEGKFGLQIGGSYNFSKNRKLFGTFKSFKWDQTNGAVKTKGSLSFYTLGYGKTITTSKNSHAFVRVSYEGLKITMEKSGIAKAELKTSIVPVVLGFEAKAKSWLTLRGSIAHNLVGNAEAKNLSSYLAAFGANLHTGIIKSNNGTTSTGYLEGKQSIANSTVVNAGATLNFGNLEIDGFIGTTGGSRTVAVPTTATNNASDTNEGILSTDNLLTRVGMTYKF